MRTGLSTDPIAHALIDNLHCLQAKTPQHATPNDWYMALAYTVRDRMLDGYVRTVDAIAAPASEGKVVAAIDLIGGGFFSDGDPDLFRPLVESLLTRDDYLLLADYQAYVDCQQRVSDAYRDENSWTRMSILNSARVGRFSSDRSIREYCREIWNVGPIAPARS